MFMDTHTHTHVLNLNHCLTMIGMVITNLEMRELRQRKTVQREFNLFLDSKRSVLSAKPHRFAGLPALMNSFTSRILDLARFDFQEYMPFTSVFRIPLFSSSSKSNTDEMANNI